MSGGGRADERVGELAEALTRLGPRTLTWPALCSRAGVDHSVADVLWRALEFVVREARTGSGFLGRIAEVQVDALVELEALGLRAEARSAARADGLDLHRPGGLHAREHRSRRC